MKCKPDTTVTMKRKSTKIEHLLEYIGIRLLLAIVDHLPLSFSERIARFLADIWYTLKQPRRETAKENIRRSGVASNPSEIDRIARDSFRHFAVLIIESLKSDLFFTEDNWREKIELDIPESTMKLFYNPDQGIILISGHFGNWEVAAQLLSFLKPVTAITRHMRNPYANKIMLKRKPKNRVTLTPKHDADTGRFLATLKNGHMLALLNDQYAKNRGMMVNFFGIPASTHTSPALLHFITKAPLCFGYCVRTGPMQFKLKALEPMVFKPTGDRAKDTRLVLETLNHELEKAVREYPEQYLWAHRRWRD